MWPACAQLRPLMVMSPSMLILPLLIRMMLLRSEKSRL
jgi:hypothetical protein